MNETNKLTCMNCSCIGYVQRSNYYRRWYCKLNGKEVWLSANEENHMEWCPLNKVGEAE